MNESQVATGFDCQPLPDGNVLMEFFGDDGKTCQSQVVTKGCIESMPLVAQMTLVVIEQGADALLAAMAEPKKAGFEPSSN